MKTFILLLCMAVFCMSVNSSPLFERMFGDTMRRQIHENIAKRGLIKIDVNTFNVVDSDGNGHIDAGEFADYLKQFNPNYDPSKHSRDFLMRFFQETLPSIDTNENGTVELYEFLDIGNKQ